MWRQNTTSKDEGAGSENFTVLGKDVHFTGVVHFEGTVRMDSCFEEEIYTKGVLTVGEHAVIKGTITATEKVQLLKSAILVGDVHCPNFAMEEGAHIQGQIDMGASPWVDESPQDTVSLRDVTPPRKVKREQVLDET
jgi:cytoskeletal protein CcmA (bactofilin family)